MAYATYFEERTLYREQVERYHDYVKRLQAKGVEIRPNTWDARELADLRIEAEQTWFRVSTFGWPWSWLFRRDVSWSRIRPHASEPEQESLERVIREWKVRSIARSLERALEDVAHDVDVTVRSAGIETFLQWHEGKPRQSESRGSGSSQ